MIQNGTLLGNRYEILDLVGTGGMADVYKAKCHRLNRFVAIKVLKEEFGKDDDFVKRFHVEAQAAGGLTHPNIVNIYDVGEEDGLHYIVMELIEGITLKEYIKNKGALSAKEAVEIAIQIAEGIEAAHIKKTVHRDIKPQNIIIDKQGRVKVTDFGIARATGSGTITVSAMGSVHYFSPEQARNGYVDARSDIYSLGITIYEMVTGHVPFDGENPVSIALKHIQDEIVFTEEEKAVIPRSLEYIILKAAAKKKEQRYATATLMIADLKKVFDDPSGIYVKTGAPAVSGGTMVMSGKEVNKIKELSGKSEELKPEPEEKEEEESLFHNTKDMNPKLEKIIIGLTVGIALIFAILFITFFAKSFRNFFGSNLNPGVTTTGGLSSETTTTEYSSETTTGLSANLVFVPDVVGKEREAAIAMLEKEGLYAVIETDVSDEIEEDHVIRQMTISGTEVEKGSRIIIVISEGKGSVRVEDVIGMKESKAKETLEKQGFVVEIKQEYSSKYEKGLVSATTPDAEEKAVYGSTVTIVVSKGPKEVSVPSLLGRTKKEVRTILEDAELSLGEVSYDHSDRYEEGTVMFQSKEKGTKVKAGTVINIVISQGPAKVNVSYKGDITINCPLAEGVESGEVVLELSQKGNTKNVYNNTLTRGDFPLHVSFDGYAEGNAVVTVYVDGSVYKSYDVTIEKVTN